MVIGTHTHTCRRVESFDDSGGDGGGNSALAQKGPPVAFKVLKTIHQARYHHHQLRPVWCLHGTVGQMIGLPQTGSSSGVLIGPCTCTLRRLSRPKGMKR